jgi:hypothetical protein
MSDVSKFLPPKKVIDGGDMEEELVSLVTTISTKDNIVYQASWAGVDTTGIITVEGSANYVPGLGGTVLAEGDWIPLRLSPEPLIDGGASSLFVILSQLPFPYIRCRYSPFGGFGALTVTISGKEI